MDKAKYDIAIVTFFDILGFRGIVEEPKEPSEILDTLSLLKHASEPPPDLADAYELSFTNFSDSIVRSTRIISEANQQYPIGLVFQELIDLVHIQMQMILRGVLIRGGVAIGEVYHSNPFIFGPALNRAYELESTIARYPRIVVDDWIPDTVDMPLLRARHHTPEIEREFVEGLLRTASDGTLFVDYLKVAHKETDDTYEYLEFLRQHRDLIVGQYLKHGSEPKIAEKYQWLAAYQNTVVEEFSDGMRRFGVDPQPLLIGPDEVPAARQI